MGDHDVVESGSGDGGDTVVHGTIQTELCRPERRGARVLRPPSDVGIVAHHEHRRGPERLHDTVGQPTCQSHALGVGEHGCESLLRLGECLHGHEHGDIHPASVGSVCEPDRTTVNIGTPTG